jgi:hypothetical protein
MKIKEAPQEGSYEAALTEEQRISLHALLLSGITLAQAQKEALPWPEGPDKDHKPSPACLWRIKARLRNEQRFLRLETAAATLRATQKLLKRLVKTTDQEQVLDQAMTLIGQQVIDAGLELDGAASNSTAAWMLLRRADQRRFDQRTAIFEAQAGKGKNAGEDAPLPAMSEEEKEQRFSEIFGTLQPQP